jgi:hypothetical protein
MNFCDKRNALPCFARMNDALRKTGMTQSGLRCETNHRTVPRSLGADGNAGCWAHSRGSAAHSVSSTGRYRPTVPKPPPICCPTVLRVPYALRFVDEICRGTQEVVATNPLRSRPLPDMLETGRHAGVEYGLHLAAFSKPSNARQFDWMRTRDRI